MKGLITRIQRFSTTNGPGLRSTVFLKGCPLHCFWCHNPETQNGKRELLFYGEQCTGCGICVKSCPTGVHELQNTDSGFRHMLNREKCILCGACAARCPSEALETAGFSTVMPIVSDFAKALEEIGFSQIFVAPNDLRDPRDEIDR